MTPFAWAIVCFVVFDLALAVFIVRAMTSSAFGSLADEFPKVEPGDVHTERKRQSFSMGLLNFGFAVRVRVDDAHVHLSPEPYIKWSGMPSMSIPIDRFGTKGAARGRWLPHTVLIDSDRSNTELSCPKWLWQLIAGES